MHYFTRFSLILFTVLYTIFSVSAQVNKQQVQNFNTKQPSRFSENKGQITDQDGNLRTDVKYIYNAPGFNAIFKDNSFSYEVYTVEKKPKQISEATGKPVDNLLPDKFKQPEDVTVKTHRIDIFLPGANKHPEIIVEGKSADYNNYYLAHTPEQGVQKVYSYTKLTYKNIWPKVDIVFYAKKEGELKYDIVVHPGGKLSDVKFAYNGASVPKLVDGKLRLNTALGSVKEHIPLSYTQQDKQKVSIKYINKQNIISFDGKYNIGKTLIIDPVISWATYYGGSTAGGTVESMVDKSGNVYLVGTTFNSKSISTSGAFQTTLAGWLDAYVSKFGRTGNRIWATYYGGDSVETVLGSALDPTNNIYITGYTESGNGIASTGAFQTSFGGKHDVFIIKLDNSGSRRWSTYYGGTGYDEAFSITSNSSNDIFIAGGTNSDSSIATSGAFKTYLGNKYPTTSNDAFLVKFDSQGKRSWGTYYGYSGYDAAFSVDCDSLDNIYLCGYTSSLSNIATPGAHQTIFMGNNAEEDAFLVKFSASGARIWGTYFGGRRKELPQSTSTDKFGNVYLVGYTRSTSNITTSGAHQEYNNDSTSNIGFLAKFDSSGTIIWATYYGGVSTSVIDVATDDSSNIFIVGYTRSLVNIATSDAFDSTFNGNNDAFVAKFNSSGIKLWGTYYGGVKNEMARSISLDNRQNIYLAGWTSSDSSIATSNGHNSSFDSLFWIQDFLTKFTFNNPDAGIIVLDSLDDNYCGNKTVNLYIKLKNFSYDITIDSLLVGWSFNDTLQTPIKYTKLLDFSDTSELISLSMATLVKGPNTFKVWTYNPNGKLDQDPTNDTLSKTVTLSACVWPGDANADKVVNNKDILAIGVAYGNTGSTRTDTSTTWKAHLVKDWSKNFSSGENYKHADSDGNGLVSNTDTLAVTRNYSKTHSKKEGVNRGKNTDPLLRVEIQNDSLKAGDTLVAYIMLGESGLPAKDVYGIAFSLYYNKDYFSTVKVDFTGNWLGNNTLGYSNSTNGLDLALTKTDHKNATGSGRIATVRMILKEQELNLDQLKVEIVDNIVISANEQVIPTNVEDDSVNTYKEPNGIFNSNKPQQTEVKVYPNPFSSQTNVEFTLEKPSNVTMVLYDVTGKSYVVYNVNNHPQGKHIFGLDTKPYNLKGGVYMLKVIVDGVATNKRIVKVD